MSGGPARPSLLARLLLWMRPLGDRRADVEADLIELFDARVAGHGLRHARRRYLIDVLSLWTRHPARRHVPAPNHETTRSWWSGIAGDIRFGVRIFRRQTTVVLVAIAGLALAIGITVVVFTIVSAFTLRSIGVSDPDAVVRIQRTIGNTLAALESWSFADYLRLREMARLVKPEATIRARPSLSSTPGDESGQPVDVRFVTGTFDKTFGSRTILGRAIGPEDDAPGAPAVAVLNHAFWRTMLGGDAAAVGRPLYLNGVSVTVIGVFDRQSTGPFQANFAASIQLPLSAARLIDPLAFDESRAFPVIVTGLLVRPATIAQAEAEVTAIASRLGLIHEGGFARAAVGVVVRPENQLTGEDLALLSIFMTIVGLVLLLAVTNVANLLLAGATTRRQEIGARLALGASPGRIVRQLTTESLLLGIASGVIGLALAMWITPLVARVIKMPPAVDLSVDARVVLFASVVSVLVGVAASLAPARFSVRGNLADTLKAGTTQSGSASRAVRLRSAFLGVQAAASVILLVFTAFFTRILFQASGASLGIDPDRLVVVTALVPRAGGQIPADQFWDVALARVRAVSGVERAALVEYAPAMSAFHPLAATLNGQRYPLLQNSCSPEYFATAGFQLVAGRTFAPDEFHPSMPVAVITESLARDFWPDGNVVGLTLERVKDSLKEVRVVGIVTDATPKIWPPNYLKAATIFRPLADPEVARMVVRLADGSPAPLRAIRVAVSAIDASRRPQVSLVSEGVQRQLEGPRILASGAAVIGGLALTLAVMGIVGVTTFVVSQQRHEISIRLAIGANRRDVVWNIFRRGMRPIAIGLAIGLTPAFFGARYLGLALGGLTMRDPISFGAATAVLLIAASLGVLIPARRAAHVDPAAVLKEQ